VKIFKSFLNLLPENVAYAHCDIPCGIYDPHQAQLAAHTIIRMTQLLMDVKVDDQKQATHDISRITHVKEEHASILEEELETLRNDYFKEEHFKNYPNLNELFAKTLKSASKARQEISMEAAQEVLSGTQDIAEIFFKTKNVEPVRVKSLYPTGGEIVLHK
jgi:nickel superoxide dismutase